MLFIFKLKTNDIKKNDGTVLVVGLRSIGGDDAQTQLDTMKDVISWNYGENVADNNHFVNKVFSSIKNLMSDRYVTQTKFNKNIYRIFMFSFTRYCF